MNVLTDLFTNYQKNILLAFIDCIKYSHSLGQNKWGVYLNTPNHLRLIIGGLIVTTIEQGHLWLTLPILGETGHSFFDDLGNWAWESRWVYKVIPSLSGYYWPMTNHDEIWPRISNYHFFYLREVAEKYRHLRKPSQRKHSDDVLIDLELFSGQTLPRPNYSR